MKASLHLQLTSQLAMTPQMQQAIRLLQLSSPELEQEILQALESNPLLELDESSYDDSPSPEQELLTGDERSNIQDQHDWVEPALNSTEPPETQLHQDIPDQLQNDAQWQDVYPSSYNPKASSPQEERRSVESSYGTDVTLEQYLLDQLNLIPLTQQDKIIGYCLIQSLDSDGYLRDSLEEVGIQCAKLLSKPLNTGHSHQDMESHNSEALDLAEITTILHLIQHLDPPGVAATSLSECLERQLQQLPPETHGRAAALALCDFGLEKITELDPPQLSKGAQLTIMELNKAMTLIRSLKHAPSEGIIKNQTDYITPDITVERHNGQWVAHLNRDHIPKLRIHHYYQNLISQPKHKTDLPYLKNNLTEARWLLKSLENRNDTLLKVAKEIVNFQRAFFDYGPEAMKPLVLHDIAERIDMHDSTISRITSNKYLTCPLGTFELKYFFSSHVSTNIGGSCSATAIRAMIKRLVQSECPDKPLSDSKLAFKLEQQGIQVARRTIAKYREAINIPPSKERKRVL